MLDGTIKQYDPVDLRSCLTSLAYGTLVCDNLDNLKSMNGALSFFKLSEMNFSCQY